MSSVSDASQKRFGPRFCEASLTTRQPLVDSYSFDSCYSWWSLFGRSQFAQQVRAVGVGRVVRRALRVQVGGLGQRRAQGEDAARHGAALGLAKAHRRPRRVVTGAQL